MNVSPGTARRADGVPDASRRLNILLINHYAGSPAHGMEYRPYYMARAWQALGHRTRIVAASFAHVRSKQPAPVRKVTLEDVAGVEYCWVPAPAYDGNGLARIRNMAAFVSGLARHSSAITAKFSPDVVITSSTYPLDSYPGSWIARRHGAKLVHEIHDLWPLSPMELGKMSRWHPFIVAMQAAENHAYRRSDKVVSMLAKAEPHMRAHGLAEGKFVYIPNGIPVEDWESSTEDVPDAGAAALARFRARFPFLVGYAGAHGVANALEALVDAAALVREERIGVVLVGQGPEKPLLQRLATERGLDNILFLESIRKRAIPALLDRMDALYIGLQRQPLFRFGVSPNKLMDYMMAAKPVIHAIEAGNDLVQESGCGISVAAEDPGAIAGAMRTLVQTTPEARRAMGARGKQYILQHHTYDVLSRRFIDALSGTRLDGAPHVVSDERTEETRPGTEVFTP